MNETTYRLIFQSLEKGVQLPKLIAYFQKELGLSEGTIRGLLTQPPRVLCEVSNQNHGNLMEQTLKRLGCQAAAEPVVAHPSFPFVVSRDHYRVMNQELSKVLRVQANMAFCLAQASHPAPDTILPSMMGVLNREMNAVFRDSDTVLAIDDVRLVVLGFSTDKEGVKKLTYKIDQFLNETLGKEVHITTGCAVFPQEGKNLQTLLSLAEEKRKRKDRASISKTAPEAVKTQTQKPAKTASSDAGSLTQSLMKARGKTLQRLQKVRPDVLWLGLSQIPETDQRTFVSRLPFDAPLATSLMEMIDAQKKPVSNGDAVDRLHAIIQQMDENNGNNGHKEIKQDILSRLHRVEALPTLPAIASHIFTIASDPDSSAQDLTSLIENDPPLTSKLLKIVNSAFYGFPQKIGTVKQAVVILGLDEIMDLSFGLAAAKVFNTGKTPDGMDPKDLWRHSMGTALISQKLCQEMPQCDRLGGFTAGLLHDFGKIFMLEQYEEPYCDVYQICLQDGLPLFEMEESRFGLNHAQVGKHLASHWNLPVSLVNAVAHHHQPFTAGDHSELAAMVGLADYLFHRAEAEQNETDTNTVLPPLLTVGHWNILVDQFKGLNAARLNHMTEEAKALLSQSSHIFAMLDG